ncbi:choline transporter-like protein 5 [Trichosurus vulpecula]|uniref:choline transporter-like protein 5 n=1 Tax=Trichosurus vulpecula TaxID=9337 RepID=UPI00186AC13F|nr:choline transporter-like protein 5 [Trichosurus vulpecula]
MALEDSMLALTVKMKNLRAISFLRHGWFIVVRVLEKDQNDITLLGSRSCTDVVCCFIFIGVILVYIVLGLLELPGDAATVQRTHGEGALMLSQGKAWMEFSSLKQQLVSVSAAFSSLSKAKRMSPYIEGWTGPRLQGLPTLVKSQNPKANENGKRNVGSEMGPILPWSLTACVTLGELVVSSIKAGVAWAYGDAKKVAYATDSNGEFCGQKNTRNEKKTFLFYFNPLKCTSSIVLTKLQCPTRQLCVSMCPDRLLTFIDVQNKHQTDQNLWEYYRQYCKPGFNDPLKPALEVFQNEDCPPVIFPSQSFLKRCFPDLSAIHGTVALNKTVFFNGIGTSMNITDFQKAVNGTRTIGLKVFEDFVNSWHWILTGLFLAMISSFLFLWFLRYTAGVILWFILFGMVIIIAFGIWICYREYDRLQSKPGAQVTFYDVGFQSDFRAYLQVPQTWLAFMILLCIVETFVLLTILFLRKRISIAVTLLKEGSRAIGHIPQSLLYPVITFFLISICISYWIVIAFLLATSGKAVYKVLNFGTNCKYANETCDPKTFHSTNIIKECPGADCIFAFYGGKSILYEYVLIFQLLNAFVFLWLVNFSIALGQCTLAGAFASYYWAFQKPKDIPSRPLCASFGRALRYHTGSLAFGSLIISIVQILRVILEYLSYRLKGSQNSLVKFILFCLRCCFWCLEKMLKFINRNAYIMIAIYGESFCAAARNAFMLVTRNVLRVAVLDTVTDFLLWMGKLLISLGIGVLGFMFFTKKLPLTAPTLNYYWVPLLMIVLGSYFIAHGFFSVFGMCVDTLFLCFCEDLERNDGSIEKPYYMSPKLLQILGKKQAKGEE